MNSSSNPKQEKSFKWPVVSRLTLNGDAQQVWQLISSPGILEKCNPFCRKNIVKEWQGVGSRDTIYYYSGVVIDRHFTKWIEGVGYDIEAKERKGHKSNVLWRISPKENGKSELSIEIQPHHLQHIPIVKRWFIHHFYFQPIAKQYVSKVLQGFDWYLTTGEFVKQNQFGSHQWFSMS